MPDGGVETHADDGVAFPLVPRPSQWWSGGKAVRHHNNISNNNNIL